MNLHNEAIFRSKQQGAVGFKVAEQATWSYSKVLLCRHQD